MVKGCASPARQKWYWILWGRCWGSFLGGWCWSQHTSSWLWGEVVSVTSSNGVRWHCQSDNATGAQGFWKLTSTKGNQDPEVTDWRKGNSKAWLQFSALFVISHKNFNTFQVKFAFSFISLFDFAVFLLHGKNGGFCLSVFLTPGKAR